MAHLISLCNGLVKARVLCQTDVDVSKVEMWQWLKSCMQHVLR